MKWPVVWFMCACWGCGQAPLPPVPSVVTTLPAASGAVPSEGPSDTGTYMVQGEHIVGSDGSRTAIALYDATIQHRFPRSGQAPILLVQGRTSKDHGARLSLYVIDIERPIPSWSDGAHAWHTAGSLQERGSSEPFYRGDVFSGDVLPGSTGVIWYERILRSDGAWENSTTFLRIEGGAMDTTVFFGHDRLPVTQRQAFKGACRMIAPLAQELPS